VLTANEYGFGWTNNYFVFSNPNQFRVTVFIINKFNIINIREHCITNCNSLKIKFEYNNTIYYCTRIYRSLSINLINFVNSLQSW